MKKIAMLILILLFSLNTSVASAQKAQYEEFYNPAGFRAEWTNPYSEEYVASLDKKFTEWEKSMGQEYYSITLDNENKFYSYDVYNLLSFSTLYGVGSGFAYQDESFFGATDEIRFYVVDMKASYDGNHLYIFAVDITDYQPRVLYMDGDFGEGKGLDLIDTANSELYQLFYNHVKDELVERMGSDVYLMDFFFLE